MKLPKDFREFIALLNSENVRYVIVGGYAVAFHGYPRFTGDIDFFVEATAENAVRLMRVLARFGFGELGLTERDFTMPDQVVQLGMAPNRIDLVTGISGVSFAEAWDNKVESTLEGLPVNFVSKAVLIRNKTAAGRAKDRADIQETTDADETPGTTDKSGG